MNSILKKIQELREAIDNTEGSGATVYIILDELEAECREYKCVHQVFEDFTNSINT